MDSQLIQAKAEAAQQTLNSANVYCLFIPFLHGQVKNLQIQMLKGKCNEAKQALSEPLLLEHEKNAGVPNYTDIPLPCQSCLVSRNVRGPLVEILTRDD